MRKFKPGRQRDDEKTGRIDLRPECRATFAGIESALYEVADTVKDLSEKFSKVSERMAKQEVSQQTLINHINKDIVPAVSNLPKVFTAGIKEHSKECLANARLLNRITKYSSDAPPLHPRGDTTSRFSLPSPTTLKWILYAGLLLGGLIAGIWGATRIGTASPRSSPTPAHVNPPPFSQ